MHSLNTTRAIGTLLSLIQVLNKHKSSKSNYMEIVNRFLFLSQFNLNKHPGNSKLNTLLSFSMDKTVFFTINHEHNGKIRALK